MFVTCAIRSHRVAEPLQPPRASGIVLPANVDPIFIYLGHDSCMVGPVPEDIVSPRWPYVMLAAAAGLMVVAVAMMLVVGRHFDWTFFAMMLPLEAGLVVWLVSLLPKVARPPALRIDATGLTLRKGLKERAWRWCQIDTFYLQALQRGATVGNSLWLANNNP